MPISIHEKDKETQNYIPIILSSIPHTINSTDLNIPTTNNQTVQKYIGKVRDRYTSDENVVLLTTDRLSAFDRHITSVPFKGAVLNLISKFWFEKTKHIMPNHLVSTPHPNVTIGKSVTPIPIEFVVRNYLTGTTDTSVLTHYNRGVRNYCGVELPDGMRPHEKFVSPIITPTTKSSEHDELISPAEIIKRGIMTPEEWDYCSKKAIELFNFASEEAAKRGLILVDTKMEMGRDENGNIILIDELFTPDSSRYWLSENYDASFAKGETPKSIDKEFIRRWIKEQCDPYTTEQLPKVPDEQIAELSRRYILLYELITGQKFDFHKVIATQTDINKAVNTALSPKVAIIMGSDSDLATMIDAAKLLEKLGVSDAQVEVTIVSAHRTTDRLVSYARSAAERGIQVIIAGAGGAAHLPGMVASMTTLPVIGVPVVPATAAYLNGIDALYSILQMPAGIPVATVAIGNATNAGLLAARILANDDLSIKENLTKYMANMRDTVLDKATRLENEGWKQYTYQQNAVTFTAKVPPKTAVESDKAANTLFKLAK